MNTTKWIVNISASIPTQTSTSRGLARCSTIFTGLNHSSVLEGNQRVTSAINTAVHCRYVHNPLYKRGRGPHPNQPLRSVLERKKNEELQRMTEKLMNEPPPIWTKVTPQLPEFDNNTLPVYSFETGMKVREITLNPEIFNITPRPDILARVVTWQRNAMRRGTGSTKTRAEVSGTGKKPFPQKGTGRARQGSLRGPHQYHGGVSHGPKPRDFSTNLPKKVRALGVRMALSTKVSEKNVMILENTTFSSHKTRHMAEAMKRLNLKEFLMVYDNQKEVLDPNCALAARNIQHCDFLPAQGLNVLMILRHPTLVLTEAAVSMITEFWDPLRLSRIKFMVGEKGHGLTTKDFLKVRENLKVSAFFNNEYSSYEIPGPQRSRIPSIKNNQRRVSQNKRPNRLRLDR